MAHKPPACIMIPEGFDIRNLRDNPRGIMLMGFSMLSYGLHLMV